MDIHHPRENAEIIVSNIWLCMEDKKGNKIILLWFSNILPSFRRCVHFGVATIAVSLSYLVADLNGSIDDDIDQIRYDTYSM